MSTKKNTKKNLLGPLLEKLVGPVTFGMFLRVARTSLGLSQAELARRLGVSRGTLCDIEKGRQLVSPSLAVRIARKAGLSEKLALETCFQDQLRRARIKMRVTLVA